MVPGVRVGSGDGACPRTRWSAAVLPLRRPPRVGARPRLGDLVMEQCKRHPCGLGALTVVPPHARPLSPEVRRAVGETWLASPSPLHFGNGPPAAARHR